MAEVASMFHLSPKYNDFTSTGSGEVRLSFLVAGRLWMNVNLLYWPTTAMLMVNVQTLNLEY